MEIVLITTNSTINVSFTSASFFYEEFAAPTPAERFSEESSEKLSAAIVYVSFLCALGGNATRHHAIFVLDWQNFCTHLLYV
jgi:hypothetical protein